MILFILVALVMEAREKTFAPKEVLKFGQFVSIILKLPNAEVLHVVVDEVFLVPYTNVAENYIHVVVVDRVGDRVGGLVRTGICYENS
eukprot:m.26732 g.26732  ORF g.26732 m.26732 type:complete len:88 (+) comp5883_c0_seq1:468-731(+)